ncbi:MAG: DUF3565 domain-containing protein [Nitrospina sp.]|nr:MAG: DUF3565 domain-containing protein [Nitrospina sp.]
MKTTITGFHQDEESHWVTDLACGHTRHFRHHPPSYRKKPPNPPSASSGQALRRRGDLTAAGMGELPISTFLGLPLSSNLESSRIQGL